MILCILKSILAWAIMSFLSTNLIGSVMRGLLWVLPSFDREVSDDRLNRLIDSEGRRMKVANAIDTLLSVGATAGFLYALFHFWNLGLALAGAILMLGRLPDLLYEIETGKTGKQLPKGWVYTLGMVLFWCAGPLIWYSLCMCE